MASLCMEPLANPGYASCHDYYVLVRELEDMDGIFPTTNDMNRIFRPEAVSLMSKGYSILAAVRQIRQDHNLFINFVSKYQSHERSTLCSLLEAFKRRHRTPKTWNRPSHESRLDAHSLAEQIESRFGDNGVAESSSTMNREEWETGPSCRTYVSGPIRCSAECAVEEEILPQSIGMKRVDSGIAEEDEDEDEDSEDEWDEDNDVPLRPFHTLRLVQPIEDDEDED